MPDRYIVDADAMRLVELQAKLNAMSKKGYNIISVSTFLLMPPQPNKFQCIIVAENPYG